MSLPISYPSSQSTLLNQALNSFFPLCLCQLSNDTTPLTLFLRPTDSRKTTYHHYCLLGGLHACVLLTFASTLLRKSSLFGIIIYTFLFYLFICNNYGCRGARGTLGSNRKHALSSIQSSLCLLEQRSFSRQPKQRPNFHQRQTFTSPQLSSHPTTREEILV